MLRENNAVQPHAVRQLDAVAIVGVGVRLPGGICSLDDLWRVLADGGDQITDAPAERFEQARFLDPSGSRPGKTYTVSGGFVGDLAAFDADYFGISPKEAAKIDPQHRLLLECAVEAFDDAGIDPATFAGSDTAVFMGISTRDYGELQDRRPRTGSAYDMSGSAACNAANRLSYYFDLQGPSAAIDTACSSTMFAVHEGCEALRSGRSRLALAGGVNVLLSPQPFVSASRASMLSPTGRCHAFSALADGYVRAEGAGVFLLKPLAAAIADGDRIHAVIAGSAVNCDGRTAGLSMPSPDAQARMLQRAYASAGIEAADVDYVEAHGTGTKAGDPVECTALGRVLGAHRNGTALPIGSVKSNVGHLESAAGVAGLAKALLVLRERHIPRTLHSEPLNDAIDFAGLGLAPATAARDLPSSGQCVVGVNSFGFGGANGHVVLTSAPLVADDAPGAPDAQLPVVVSARTRPALAAAAAALADHLDRTDPDDFYRAAYTSARRRAGHRHRSVVLAASPAQAATRLRGLAEGDPDADVVAAVSGEATRRGKVGFVFCGNGALWVGAGAALLETDAAFRAEVDALDAELTPLLGWSVREQLSTTGDGSRWGHTEVAQPLLFTIQAGLVSALAARGVVPRAVAGHSVGEVAAAYCAGALDRPGACRVIVERSLAQAPTRGAGRMAAVGLGAHDATRRLAEAGLAEQLGIAGVNGPHDVTVSGDAGALAGWGAQLAEEGVFFRDLKLDYAFHSPAMDRLRDRLAAGLGHLDARPTVLPMFSTVTGAETREPLDAKYWWRNIREPVQFQDAVAAMTGPDGCDVLVEIGPLPVLRTYLSRNTAHLPYPVVVVPTLSRAATGAEALDTTLVSVLAAGAEIDWDETFPTAVAPVSLPAYPWQRERHWNGAPSWWLDGAAAERVEEHPLLGQRQPAAEPQWQQSIEPARLSWLADHKVGDAVVVPAAAFVDMALSAGRLVFDGPVEITRLTIEAALVLAFDDPGMEVLLHTQMSAQDGSFTIASRTESGTDWKVHARGRARRLLRARPTALDEAALGAGMETVVDAAAHYRRCDGIGLFYGPAFQTVHSVRTDGSASLAILHQVVPNHGIVSHVAAESAYQVHPTILDGALQSGVTLGPDAGPDAVPYLPAGVETVRCWGPVGADATVHVRHRSATPMEITWDITLTDPDGNVSLELRGMRLRRFLGATRSDVGRFTDVLMAQPLDDQPAMPAPLADPSVVAAACAEELAGLAERFHTNDYARFQPRYLALIAHFICASVRELLPRRDSFSMSDLRAAGVIEVREPLVRHLLQVAESHHLLTTHEAPDGQLWRHQQVPVPEQMFRDMMRDFPSEVAFLWASGVCGRHLTDVLCGRQDPLELLFSDSDTLATRIYDRTPSLIFQSHLARMLLRATTTDWPADRPLRILEIGAGTGSPTKLMLPTLPADRTHYVYTDITPVFFGTARERLRRFDFVEYRTLNIDEDPRAQGFADGSFDIVIASNMLHATRDLAVTLGRIADLLTDGGQLLAVEVTNTQLLLLVYGLLDSYWSVGDPQLRADSPTLTRDAWTSVLENCGFRDIVHVGDSEEPARNDWTTLLASRRAREAPLPRAVTAPPGGPLVIASLAAGDSRAAALAIQLTNRCGEVSEVAQPRDAAAWSAVLAECRGPIELIIPLDGSDEDGVSPEAITERAVQYCAVLRAVATACAQAPAGVEPTMWLVTLTACPHPPALPPSQGASAAVWGAARSVLNELPSLQIKRVALAWSDQHPDGPADALLAEIASRSTEEEVLITAGGRFVARTRPPETPRHEITDVDNHPYMLRVTNPGSRYVLDWHPAVLQRPGPGEVLLAVRAAGLNYRDVLVLQDQLPADAGPANGSTSSFLGMECAGIVIATGPGVTDRAVGDRVMALALFDPGSHAIASAAHTIPMPDDMTFAQAATMPIVFLTVHHALDYLARLAPGETVLVHAGAGGVGMAALQYADYIGARVIATAGTPAKRDLLRTLGVEHVLDSRSLDFAEEVMDITGGQGVDVVLNSLAGEGLVRSLTVLKRFGRFVELGKRDIMADNPLPLAAFTGNLSFSSADVFSMVADDAPLAAVHLDAIARRISEGIYRPLPFWTFPAARIDDAYTYLRLSRHVGKIVVTHGDAVEVQSGTKRCRLRPDATYLITGGLSGLGAVTARHLAAHGARHLALVSRRGAHAPEAEQLLEELRELGVTATPYAADAADAAAMKHVIDDIDGGGHRLAGVVHGAMVLRDAPFTELADDDVRAILAPKMTGGWVLDQLTRALDLDFFVCYSSATTMIGNVLQAPYAAGNAALDALVRQRHRAGLPGVSIQWGAIADAGYVARNNLVDSLRAVGFDAFPARHAMTAFSELVDDPTARTVAVAVVDWARLTAHLPRLAAPRIAGLIPAQSDIPTRDAARDAIANASDEEALALTEDVLISLLATVMQAEPDRIARDRRLDQIGVDSLMANEFATRIRDVLGHAVPTMEVTAAPDLTTLAQRVLQGMDRTAPRASVGAASHATQGAST